MDTIQNVRMLISLATGSKETLTAWVNTNTVKIQREISSPVKKQPQNEKRIHSKRKSNSKNPLRAKTRKVEEITGTKSQ